MEITVDLKRVDKDLWRSDCPSNELSPASGSSPPTSFNAETKLTEIQELQALTAVHVKSVLDEAELISNSSSLNNSRLTINILLWTSSIDLSVTGTEWYIFNPNLRSNCPVEYASQETEDLIHAQCTFINKNVQMDEHNQEGIPACRKGQGQPLYQTVHEDGNLVHTQLFVLVWIVHWVAENKQPFKIVQDSAFLTFMNNGRLKYASVALNSLTQCPPGVCKVSHLDCKDVAVAKLLTGEVLAAAFEKTLHTYVVKSQATRELHNDTMQWIYNSSVAEQVNGWFGLFLSVVFGR
ncbi:hypothetical protein L226DRAFT_520367 [Lentinus tigrinus ALCF2SS1-7]|uniref:uncharacterized protein n=1 Tax=Lentinus tigrinus ALCF2SS1-7 TaxID=1328758 RepID=UPI001165D2A3|nr:hypothetical protein L226DRAFT_520367 [Lentinus tigrinus ALCF2SS1-7]